MPNMDHDYYMALALEQAQQAFDQGEFPVGCVIVHQGQMVARGTRTGTACSESGVCSELSHAELRALQDLEIYRAQNSHVIGSDLVLYSTMEPCLMCYSAGILAGITHIVFAYEDVMSGGMSCDLKNLSPLYRYTGIVPLKLPQGWAGKKAERFFIIFFEKNPVPI